MKNNPALPVHPADCAASPAFREDQLIVLLSLLGGLGLLAIALALLAPLAPTTVDMVGIEKVLRVKPEGLKPEPLERFLYVTGAFILPFCLASAYVGVRRLHETPRGRHIIGLLTTPTSWLMTPLIFILLFAAGLADDQAVIGMFVPGGPFSLAAAAVLAAGLTATAAVPFRHRMERILRLTLPALVGLLLLGILCFNILRPEHIRNELIFWSSFNAFFHSVVQVFFGRELLVDFTNQYGMYPHFIEPIFSLVGLSISSFTALMGLLNCLAFGCMYRFLARETGDNVLAFLGLTTILFFGYFSGRAVEPDLFLQYHPLRVLFPALSLVVVRSFAHKPGNHVGALLIALGAAATLWNPDSGIVVLASGFLLVGYDALLQRRPRDLPQRLLLGAAAAFAVFFSFSLFLRLRFGSFPDYARLFLYPQAFYIYGASMLPMPRFGLWFPVLVVYATSLLLALAALVKGEETPRARIHFFLAVLGLGLFPYYQGRSHLGNLMAAGYPAIVIGVLLASDLRHRTLSGARAADRLLSFALLTLLCFSLPATATIAPAWVRGIAEKVRVTARREESEPLRDAKFLRHYVRPGQKLVVLSYNSGLHHLLTQTTSPLDTPGHSELLYRADYERQLDYVREGRGTFVIDDRTMNMAFVSAARRANKVFYDNPYGSLIVFPAH